MFTGCARVGVTFALKPESTWSIWEAESHATKNIEVALRECGFTWGPSVGREVTPFGAVSMYTTIEPTMPVEIAVFEAPRVVMATVWIFEGDLAQPVFDAIESYQYGAPAFDEQDYEFERHFRISTGRSHPEWGYMVDHVVALTHWLDSARRRRNYDGPPTDEDGYSLSAEGDWTLW